MSFRGQDWNAAQAALRSPEVRAIQERDAAPRDVVDAVLPRVLPADWALIGRGDDGGKWAKGVLSVVASVARELDGKLWLHVSCATPHRLPSWAELREVKDIFVGRDRTALQVLPRAEKHINVHNYCLHLWCCLDGDVTPDFTRGLRTI